MAKAPCKNGRLANGKIRMVHQTDERRLCLWHEIPDGGALALDALTALGGADILLTRAGGQVAAFFNVCPHAGRRLDWAPGEFLLQDGVLTCAAHGASFAALTGACRGGPCRGEALKPVAIERRGDELWLASDDAI